MAMVNQQKKARTEFSDELRDRTKAIIEKFHNVFPEIDDNGFIFVRTTARGRRPVRIIPVKSPYHIVVSQKFIMTSYGKSYDDLDEAHRNMHIYRELLRIEDFENSKLEDYEIKDFQQIVAKYGPDWEDNVQLDNIMDEVLLSEEAEAEVQTS